MTLLLLLLLLFFTLGIKDPEGFGKKLELLFFFTLGIKDPEGFGKKIIRKCVGVTITPGSPQTQKNHVAARR